MEEAKQASERMLLQLYVAGESPNSLQALRTLLEVCGKHLHENYELEVIDVLQDPLRLIRDGIVLTPTLIKKLPSPKRTIVGDLRDLDALLNALGIVNAIDAAKTN